MLLGLFGLPPEAAVSGGSGSRHWLTQQQDGVRRYDRQLVGAVVLDQVRDTLEYPVPCSYLVKK